MHLLHLKPSQKPVKQYYQLLEKYHALTVDHEGAVRAAFQTLLESCAGKLDLTLVNEWKIKRTKQRPISVDGAIVDSFRLPHGFWEAKDISDDLDREIQKKFAAGYPKDNILFQTPQRAVLYQDGKRVLDDDITRPETLVAALRTFFEYTPPQYAEWERAADEFKERVPELASSLLELIERERKGNKRFVQAFTGFMEICRASINPNLSDAAVEEMLIQHLLTERIFSKVFDNPDFARRNVIAQEIEKVIDALTSQSFSRNEFLGRLDRFYMAIEGTAATIDDFSHKQGFLNTVYERFFRGFSVRVADTHGIVYTPQPIVNFMVKSVEEIVYKEFGKSLADKGIHILDPFVGTGNFIVRIIQEIPKTVLRHKYQHELHCNEVMLLPYYIASMNIEHQYFDATGEYLPFEGACLVDTFELAEDHTISLFTTENTERVERQKRSPIFVFISNPPYNAGQVNENDNNKNRKYPTIDRRVSETYARDSAATLTRKVDDPYVKAIRWASDRMGADGVIAFVTNNSFVDKISFDGVRKHLEQDFTRIYVLNLQGDVRKDSMRDGIAIGEINTVFGQAAMVGVSINFFIRSKAHKDRCIFYSEVDWKAKRREKFQLLESAKSIYGVDWTEVQPNSKHTWLTEGLQDDFDRYIPLGTKTPIHKSAPTQTIFRRYSLGVSTNRDAVVYDFDRDKLAKKAREFCDKYNAEVARFQQNGMPKDVDSFVDYSIKWSEHLKSMLKRGKRASFSFERIRLSMYRPFVAQWIYEDEILIDRPGIFNIIGGDELRGSNRVMCVSDKGARSPFGVLLTSMASDLHLCSSKDAFQCFPFYTYDGDSTNRQENITDWSLAEFRGKYKDEAISKWDIFYYVYAVLHHPTYRTRYEANLKRDLPHIPYVSDFRSFSHAGKRLVELHVSYDQGPEYPLKMIETPGMQLEWRVEKMKLSRDKTQVQYNDFLTLAGIPPEALEYRLGNRSALEWMVDQYRVSTDARSGITNDPNRADDPEYIVRLIKQVVALSVKTVEIVKALPSLVLLDMQS